MDTERIGAEEWGELQRNLEESIPVYDRINRFATLGQVSKWRRMVRNSLPQTGRILEIGCGPGSFAEDVVGRIWCDSTQFPRCSGSPRPVSGRRGQRGGTQ